MTNFKDKYRELKDARSRAPRRRGLINATNHYHRAKSFEDFSDAENRIICLSGYHGLSDYHLNGSVNCKQDPVYQKIISARENDEAIEQAIQNSGLKYAKGGNGLNMKKKHKQDLKFILDKLCEEISSRKMSEETYNDINFGGNEWLEELVIDTHPNYNPVEGVRTKMKILFDAAYNGRINLESLYKKGKEIKEDLYKKNFLLNLLRVANNEILDDAFGFIEELHDSSSRKHNSENKGEIYYHLRRLS